MITLDKIERGVVRYVDKEIVPHINEGWSIPFAGKAIELPVGLKKAVFGTAGALLAKRASSFLSAAGMVGEDGSVDVEIVRREFMTRMPEEGFLIRIPGGTEMRLTAKDVDTLYQCILDS